MRAQRSVVRALAAILVSCGGEDALSVTVAPEVLVPHTLLDRAGSLTLFVYEGDVACDPATGAFDGAGGQELAKQTLTRSGCAPDVRFCGTVSIAKSSAERTFAVRAVDASNEVLAVGCARAKVEKDFVPLSIRMFRYLPQAICGDGKIQPTEQCEPGGTAVCDENCHSRELLLSTGSAASGTQTGGPNEKSDPFFLWPDGAEPAGRFLAFYTDNAGGDVEVAMRVMGADLGPVSSPPALADGSIFLPHGSAFPPDPVPGAQSLPHAAFAAGKVYVVFQDDEGTGANGIDVHLRSMDSALAAEQADMPIGMNGDSGNGEPGTQGAPVVAAGPGGRLFVAWESQAEGKISGRTFLAPSTLGGQNDISIGAGNRSVSIASTPTGWVAAWQSESGIRLRSLTDDGTPQGAEQGVNQGGVPQRPRIASLADGRFAIAWSAGGDVFVQRYDARGTKAPGDQASPINDVVTAGSQSQVTIAGVPAAGGAYVVAWVDGGTGHVRGRMLGGSSGFLFNHVNGQATEFQVSREDGRVRATPVVAAGGASPFVAIGWEDESTASAGIVVRRFPLPSD